MAENPTPAPEPEPAPSEPSLPKSSPQAPAQTKWIHVADDPTGTEPDFIYGGPFVCLKPKEIFLDIACPINVPQQGTFKQSPAYFNLKEKLPVILTKVIDVMSKSGNSQAVQLLSKIKHDLITNKEYEPFKVDTKEGKLWNEWLQQLNSKYYFTNTMSWTECYVYRKIQEARELNNLTLDVFSEQKSQAFSANLEPMCILAERMKDMLPKSEKDKRKLDFCTLLKVCMWANKCDGAFKPAGGAATLAPPGDPDAARYVLLDPLQMVLDSKDKYVMDDSGKCFDNITTKGDKIRANIASKADKPFKEKCSCEKLARIAGLPCKREDGTEEFLPPPPGKGAAKGKGKAAPAPATEPEPELPKIPCPAKMVQPQFVIFDIVCDNAGYELFTDLCVAHFLIAQEMVDKVRFHLKKYPWFVSDATINDFHGVIESAVSASYSRTVEAKPKAEGEQPDPPRQVGASAVNELGRQWKQYVADGKFLVMAEDFWTYPHCYKAMKKVDPNMYRKLQFAAVIMFKGDLNYRKLVGDRKCFPYTNFDASLEGFQPAPMLMARTIKSEVIAGMPKGKYEAFCKIKPNWMVTGDYGMLQFTAKAEPFKPSPLPCIDYGDTCFSVVCPEHTDI